MNHEANIEEIEVSIQQAKDGIARKEALIRLTDNPDFRLLVREGYFEKEASRLVLLRADPNMQGEEDQKQIENNITAIGYFRLYLHTIMQLGFQFEKQLESDQETQQQLLEEDES